MDSSSAVQPSAFDEEKATDVSLDFVEDFNDAVSLADSYSVSDRSASPVSPFAAPHRSTTPPFSPPPPPPPMFRPPPVSRPPLIDWQIKPKVKLHFLKVDGKVPDVLHVLKYYSDPPNRVIDIRQSKEPFTRIPEVGDCMLPPCEASLHSTDNEKPVLEIIRNVYTRHHNVPPSCIIVDRPPPPPPPRTRSERPFNAASGSSGSAWDSDSSDDEDVHQGIVSARSPVMKIHSQHLVHALLAVIRYYPSFNRNIDVSCVKPPYRVLFHHRQELKEYRDNQPVHHSPEYAATTAKHIDVLLNFLDETLGPVLSREEELHQSSPPKATFQHFWMLLKPGEVIYAKHDDIWCPFVISSVEDVDSKVRPVESYRVNCWSLESDGTRVARRMKSFSLRAWLGEQAIGSLNVIPEAFWVDDLASQDGLPMRQYQAALGRLYWDLLKRPSFKEYEGPLGSIYKDVPTSSSETRFVHSRVVCDVAGLDKLYRSAPHPDRMRMRSNPASMGTFSLPPGQLASPPKDVLPQRLPRCVCHACSAIQDTGQLGPYWGFDELNPTVDSPPNSELFYLVLSKTIPGFVLSARCWGYLNIANLRPVRPDRNALKYLVLEEQVKMTIKALISKFAIPTDGQLSPWSFKVDKNMSGTRFFLLHGSAGVGKTSSAECAAGLMNRPLIKLTNSDLSDIGRSHSDQLEPFFQLGRRYGAVMMLDEADVYFGSFYGPPGFASRSASLVRALEKYPGVFFLTASRARKFDTALMSRIHVTLHYCKLRDEDRERIWASKFERLEQNSKGQVRVSAAAREYVLQGEEVRELQWNGREIDNNMQMALTLAEADEDRGLVVLLAEKHLRAVVKLSRDFKDSQNSIMEDDGDSSASEDESVC